jgi:hypothetical protein
VLALRVSPLNHQLLLIGNWLPDGYLYMCGRIAWRQGEVAARSRRNDVLFAVHDPQPDLGDGRVTAIRIR